MNLVAARGIVAGIPPFSSGEVMKFALFLQLPAPSAALLMRSWFPLDTTSVRLTATTRCGSGRGELLLQNLGRKKRGQELMG